MRCPSCAGQVEEVHDGVVHNLIGIYSMDKVQVRILFSIYQYKLIRVAIPKSVYQSLHIFNVGNQIVASVAEEKGHVIRNLSHVVFRRSRLTIVFVVFIFATIVIHCYIPLSDHCHTVIL